MSTVTVKLPSRFYFDHVERDLPSGVVIARTSAAVLVELDQESYNDLRSDALYYSDSSDFGAEYRGLSASARATYKALVKVGPPVDESMATEFLGGPPIENPFDPNRPFTVL